MRTILCLLLCVGAGLSLPAAEPAVKAFARPDRIRYDGQCLTIEGTDVFIFSAAFPYHQSPRGAWRERFHRIVQAGGNTVDTPLPPDFSPAGAGELRAWLAMAEDECGLYVIVRAGSRIKEAGPDIAPWQLTRRKPRRGGVILVGIDGPADAQAAAGAGIEVPLFAVEKPIFRDNPDPILGQVFDTLAISSGSNLDLLERRLADLHEAQPDAPAFISDPSPARTVPQVGAETLMALEQGAGLVEFAGLWSSPGLAPLGRLLEKSGTALARAKVWHSQAESIDPAITTTTRRDRAGGTYVFVRNAAASPRHGAVVVWIDRQGECRIRYHLGPFDLRILYMKPKETDPAKGIWLPQSPAENGSPAAAKSP